MNYSINTYMFSAMNYFVTLVCGLFIIASSILASCDLERVDVEECSGDIDPSDYIYESFLENPSAYTVKMVNQEPGVYWIAGVDIQMESFFLSKVNICQNELLSVSFGSDVNVLASVSIAQSANGDLFVAGQEHFVLQKGAYIGKINSNGVLSDVWSGFPGLNSAFYDIISSTAGTLVAAGSVQRGASSLNRDGMITFLNNNLEVIDSVQFPVVGPPFTNANEINAVVELPGSQYVGLGSSEGDDDLGIGDEMLFVKTNSAGENLSNGTRSINAGSVADHVYAIDAVATQDGNIVAVGCWEVVDGGETVMTSTFLKKMNTNGASIWESIYNANGMMQPDETITPSSIIESNDGSLFVVGTKQTHDNEALDTDIFLAKFSANGALEWDRYYGEEGIQAGEDVIEESDGGLFILGVDFSGQKIYLAKTDPLGEVE